MDTGLWTWHWRRIWEHEGQRFSCLDSGNAAARGIAEHLGEVCSAVARILFLSLARCLTYIVTWIHESESRIQDSGVSLANRRTLFNRSYSVSWLKFKGELSTYRLPGLSEMPGSVPHVAVPYL